MRSGTGSLDVAAAAIAQWSMIGDTEAGVQIGALREAVTTIESAGVLPTGAAGAAFDEFVVTSCIAGVVRAVDLAAVGLARVNPAAADPAAAFVPAVVDPAALKVAARSLLAALAVKAPGKAVEVRVPPVAAVQCVEGPRHTRGTPSNVVETDPMTWVRLAAGRLDWADAVASGALSASGERSDISALLPLL